MAKASGRRKSRGVKAKKTKSAKRVKSAKTAKSVKKVQSGFPAVWARIGDRLLKEVQSEKGWDRKALTAKIGEAEVQFQILECAKRLFPGIPALAYVPEIRAAEAAIGQVKLPSFSPELDFWQGSKDGDEPTEGNDQHS